MKKMGIIERYRERLPVTAKTPVVTLGEGDPPLIPADRLARRASLPKGSLWLKFEGANPTGSFKDRGMTLAVSKALEEGARAILCASTGNTAASAAAYAARAGLRCLVLLPQAGVALGKLAQAIAHGAEVVEVQGNFDQALELVRRAAACGKVTVVNSINPYRIQGQKTAAFEIARQLGRMPSHQCMPVGNAGNITAYWKGYKELLVGAWSVERGAKTQGAKLSTLHSPLSALPVLLGFQAKGAAPIVLGRPVKNPKTVASAIRIGNPACWQGAVEARDESGGAFQAVTDPEILAAYALLAREEGVFCEPSSAAGVAGLLKLARQGYFRRTRDPAVVCVLTGHGLKDPEQPRKLNFKMRRIRPTLGELERIL